VILLENTTECKAHSALPKTGRDRLGDRRKPLAISRLSETELVQAKRNIDEITSTAYSKKPWKSVYGTAEGRNALIDCVSRELPDELKSIVAARLNFYWEKRDIAQSVPAETSLGMSKNYTPGCHSLTLRATVRLDELPNHLNILRF